MLRMSSSTISTVRPARSDGGLGGAGSGFGSWAETLTRFSDPTRCRNPDTSFSSCSLERGLLNTIAPEADSSRLCSPGVRSAAV